MATLAQATNKQQAQTRTHSVNGVVFAETLRRDWRHILYWGISLALMGGFIVAMASELDFLEKYQQLASTFPQLIQAFGGGEAAFMATVEGFLSVEYFSWISLLYALMGVLFGLNVIANDEASGTLDVVIALPLPRWRLVLEKSLAYTVISVAVVLVAYSGLWAGNVASDVVTIDMNWFFLAVFAITPFTLAIMGLTVLLSAILRRRALVGQLLGAVVALGFTLGLLNNMATDVPALQAVARLSPFAYYRPSEIMQTGAAWGDMALLTLFFVLCTAGAMAIFQRRDIGG